MCSSNPNYLSIHPYIHPSIHPPTHPNNPPTHLPTYLPVCLSVCLFVHIYLENCNTDPRINSFSLRKTFWMYIMIIALTSYSIIGLACNIYIYERVFYEPRPHHPLCWFYVYAVLDNYLAQYFEIRTFFSHSSVRRTKERCILRELRFIYNFSNVCLSVLPDDIFIYSLPHGGCHYRFFFSLRFVDVLSSGREGCRFFWNASLRARCFPVGVFSSSSSSCFLSRLFFVALLLSLPLNVLRSTNH